MLVVTKLDRLGRNAMDVRATVEALAKTGVRVHCLALGGVDLTSAAGKMTMGVLNAVAEFERDLLIERTQAGLSRAKAEGKTLGRPLALSPEDQRTVLRRRSEGDKLLLEPKAGLKERIGFSPDEFDALILTFAQPVMMLPDYAAWAVADRRLLRHEVKRREVLQ